MKRINQDIVRLEEKHRPYCFMNKIYIVNKIDKTNSNKFYLRHGLNPFE